MLDNILIASTETTACAQRASERADDHVNLLGIDVLGFSDAAARPAKNTKGPRLIKNDTELVLFLEFNQFGQIGSISSKFEQAFGNDETPSQLLGLGLFLDNLLHVSLQIFHVTVVVPFDVASGGLEALSNGIIDFFIGNDDVSSLAERWNNAGNGGEGLSVDYAALGAKVSGNVGFGLHVDVLGPVELGRAARTDTVGAQDLNGLFLDLLIAIEVVEVERAQVRDGAAIGELCLRSSRTIEAVSVSLAGIALVQDGPTRQEWGAFRSP